MTQAKIERINALAKKQRTEGLSEAERLEQKKLRQEYIAAYRMSLEAQLERITILEPDGTKRKVEKRK